MCTTARVSGTWSASSQIKSLKLNLLCNHEIPEVRVYLSIFNFNFLSSKKIVTDIRLWLITEIVLHSLNLFTITFHFRFPQWLNHYIKWVPLLKFKFTNHFLIITRLKRKKPPLEMPSLALKKSLVLTTIVVSIVASFLYPSRGCQFSAIYNFGDSNSDTGAVSAAFGGLPPSYGKTFFGKPSGRYSDGRLIIDFIGK